MEMQLQIGEWKSVQLSLSRAGMTISDDDSSSYVSFKAETRVSIPMRNLKSDPKFKGCAFQIETGSEIKTFMASSLQDKNAWARKLNVVLGDLRQSGDFDEAENENAGPVTPVLNEKAAVPMAHSVDRQMKQKLAVQQLAQSLQPKRTAARTPAEAMVPNIDRSSEISALQEAIAEREASLQAKERELSEATQKLQREMQYREQITAGVEKWRQGSFLSLFFLFLFTILFPFRYDSSKGPEACGHERAFGPRSKARSSFGAGKSEELRDNRGAGAQNCSHGAVGRRAEARS